MNPRTKETVTANSQNGVFWNPGTALWQARVVTPEGLAGTGSYRTKDEAEVAYREAADDLLN